MARITDPTEIMAMLNSAEPSGYSHVGVVVEHSGAPHCCRGCVLRRGEAITVALWDGRVYTRDEAERLR